MWLQYSNQTASGVWLAVGYYAEGCDAGSNWASKGWFRIEPGKSATPLWTTNNYSTFYAESDDGRVWSGPYTVTLPLNAFSDWCWDLGVDPGQSVGMRLVTASNAWFPWTATINLT
ncbi:DUF1036 domain-containing protein [Kitasatospora sp. NPDC007106]|uniref:DUF1036 domain-containing protein n=1 Tax=Kitasatospora sp. NPDC007106 TaxID=3156914 RepID=UPI0033D08125